jgi:superfamily II DNA or RNA helicase
VAELIALGYLVPTRCYAPSAPDLAGVAVARGDYVEAQLAACMDKPKLVGDVVSHWHRLAERRKTVVFAVDVAHSRHLCEAFLASGVAAAHVDGATPKDERDAILARLAQGALAVVCNCMVLTEGWDQPDVSCAVLARPTRHVGLYRQMVGRVLRPAPGKADAIVIDHSGAIHAHGFVEDDVQWTLREDARATNAAPAAGQAATDGKRLVDCPRCHALRVAGEACRSCGWRPEAKPRPVAVAEGELGRVARDGTVRAAQLGRAERDAWHAQLVWFAAQRGYKPGWAAMKYREKFGCFPPWGAPPPAMAATPEVRAWIRSRQIAWARARARAHAPEEAA